MDVRPGGTYRFRTAFGVVEGEFREVDAPERLVQTFQNHLQTLEFEDLGDRTKLTQTMRFATTEERDATMQYGVEEGAKGGFARVDDAAAAATARHVRRRAGIRAAGDANPGRHGRPEGGVGLRPETPTRSVPPARLSPRRSSAPDPVSDADRGSERSGRRIRKNGGMKLSRALAIVQAVVSEAPEPVSVFVADDHGELVAAATMDGAAPDTRLNAQRKAYSAARSDARTTRELAEKVRDDAVERASFDPFFTFFLGGVAVFEGEVRVGAVGVSGLSGEVDEELALRAIDRSTDR